MCPLISLPFFSLPATLLSPWQRCITQICLSSTKSMISMLSLSRLRQTKKRRRSFCVTDLLPIRAWKHWSHLFNIHWSCLITERPDQGCFPPPEILVTLTLLASGPKNIIIITRDCSGSLSLSLPALWILDRTVTQFGPWRMRHTACSAPPSESPPRPAKQWHKSQWTLEKKRSKLFLSQKRLLHTSENSHCPSKNPWIIQTRCTVFCFPNMVRQTEA